MDREGWEERARRCVPRSVGLAQPGRRRLRRKDKDRLKKCLCLGQDGKVSWEGSLSVHDSSAESSLKNAGVVSKHWLNAMRCQVWGCGGGGSGLSRSWSLPGGAPGLEGSQPHPQQCHPLLGRERRLPRRGPEGGWRGWVRATWREAGEAESTVGSGSDAGGRRPHEECGSLWLGLEEHGGQVWGV